MFTYKTLSSSLRRALLSVAAASALLLVGCGDEAVKPTPEPAAPAEEVVVDTEPTPEPVEILPSESEAEALGSTFFVSGGEASVYSQPSDSGEFFLGSMKPGTTVTMLEEQGDFMRVQWNEGEVWVRSWYLSAADAELEAQRDASRFRLLTGAPGYLAYDEAQECFTRASMLNCRPEPNTDCIVLDQIPAGTPVTLYGQVKSFGLVRLPNGRLCFCSTNYLTGGTLCAVYPGAVDLRALLPQARFELLFASPNNITGRALYPAVPLLETHTANMLYQAYQTFLEDGYLLKVYDAYRPISAQFALYDIVQDTRFIADPNHWGSWHQRGRAVDISLISMETGEELEMPTAMHTFDMSASRTRSSRWSETARQNVDYMTRVMTEAGFGTIQTEWWHFEYTGEGTMLPIEIDYDSLSYRPATQYFN